jgi:phosphoglucosamine mutase
VTQSSSANRRVFGTDGVRGKANVFPMTPEFALRLGRAIAFVAHRGKSRQTRVLIGKDTRLSGYMFETALASGVCAMGGHVMLTGPIPTPAIAQLTQSMRADAGVVISASHNPFEDNGIKLFGPDGFKLPDEDEAAIEALLESDALDKDPVTAGAIGDAVRVDDARGRYVVFAKSTFPSRLTLDGVKVVIDAAHGAAYRAAPTVFEELGADVVALGVSPDGTNINAGCGALHPEGMARAVVEHGAAFGVALDGDADRVIVADEKGNIVDGDAIMAMCAARLLKQGKLPGQTVVATVMSNLGLEHAMRAIGGRVERTNVGDRYVVEAMKKGGFAFGGEQSGHLIFLDHATTGDGIVAALQVAALMLESGRVLSDVAKDALQRVPQILKNETFAVRAPLETLAKTQGAIRDCEARLGERGRVLVRWSGTEAKLRVMVEGEDESAIGTMAADILEAARADLEAAG